MPAKRTTSREELVRCLKLWRQLSLQRPADSLRGICNAKHPSSSPAATIPAWERGFYESAFTHANVGRITRHREGFEGLWASLSGKRTRFPTEALIVLPQTLAQFVRGERY
jgi:hypothetical protein